MPDLDIGEAVGGASRSGESAQNSAHIGLTETAFQQEMSTERQRTNALESTTQRQSRALRAHEDTLGQHESTINEQGGSIRQLNDVQGRQGNSLAAHDTRLTNLEAGRAQDRSPFGGTAEVRQNGDVTAPATGEIKSNADQMEALRQVKDQSLSSFRTGHGSGFRDTVDHLGTRLTNLGRSSENKVPLSTPRRDALLQKKIEDDPTVKLQQAKLGGALERMEAANKPGGAGNRAAFVKAAEDAEKAAKDLDAARKGIESTGVFQSGNSFSKHSTKVNAAIAGISLAAAGTTGGLIAANNETQREKTKDTSG